MSLADSERRTASQSVELSPNWEMFPHEQVYQCHVVLWPEDEGGFSAHCANLLGVVSQGDDQTEALANIADCFRETINYYREANKPIPWDKVAVDRPKDSIERWIAVRR